MILAATELQLVAEGEKCLHIALPEFRGMDPELFACLQVDEFIGAVVEIEIYLFSLIHHVKQDDLVFVVFQML